MTSRRNWPTWLSKPDCSGTDPVHRLVYGLSTHLNWLVDSMLGRRLVERARTGRTSLRYPWTVTSGTFARLGLARVGRLREPGGVEGLDDDGVELRAGVGAQLGEGALGGHGGAVRAVGRHRVEGV